MVKHLVCWNLQEEAKKEQTVAEMRRRLCALKGRIPGLLTVEVHAGFAGEWDVLLFTEFSSRAALETYRTHPEHLAVQQYIHSVICARTSFDFED